MDGRCWEKKSLKNKNVIFLINFATHCDLLSHIIVLNMFPRSRQFVGSISRQIGRRSPKPQLPYSIAFIYFVFVVLDLFISTCNPKFAILLECSDDPY